MPTEKRIDQYIGDIVGGLIREAAALQARSAALEAVNEGLRTKVIQLEQRLKDAGLLATQESYID